MAYPTQKKRKHVPGRLVTDASFFPTLAEQMTAFGFPSGAPAPNQVPIVPLPGFVFNVQPFRKHK